MFLREPCRRPAPQIKAATAGLFQGADAHRNPPKRAGVFTNVHVNQRTHAERAASGADTGALARSGLGGFRNVQLFAVRSGLIWFLWPFICPVICCFREFFSLPAANIPKALTTAF